MKQRHERSELIASSLRRLRREKAAREDRDISQAEVAAAIGASKAAVGLWEREGCLSLDKAWALADYYGVPIGRLSGREDYEPYAARAASDG